ncbi:hypothetical protein GDO78_008185 [Eleutherodactylus coqui]|uniref:Uncharacterized protein n=1 Tax=Eleutherodactylus coqui TaxID=57060 RepID=A0A8J6KAC0_ELECQ|nr:hypothetical protein GDO78_008185 [Eleutherodactylus coqui]
MIHLQSFDGKMLYCRKTFVFFLLCIGSALVKKLVSSLSPKNITNILFFSWLCTLICLIFYKLCCFFSIKYLFIISYNTARY